MKPESERHMLEIKYRAQEAQNINQNKLENNYSERRLDIPRPLSLQQGQNEIRHYTISPNQMQIPQAIQQQIQMIQKPTPISSSASYPMNQQFDLNSRSTQMLNNNPNVMHNMQFQSNLVQSPQYSAPLPLPLPFNPDPQLSANEYVQFEINLV